MISRGHRCSGTEWCNICKLRRRVGLRSRRGCLAHSCTSAPTSRHVHALQALPDGAVPATDSLDALGLEPSLVPSPGSQPPEPLPLLLFDADIQCSVQQLFRIVMGPDAVFIKAQHSRHRYWDVSVGEWAELPGTHCCLRHARGSRQRSCTKPALRLVEFSALWRQWTASIDALSELLTARQMRIPAKQ